MSTKQSSNQKLSETLELLKEALNTKMRYESIIEALLEHCASADAPSGFEQAAIDIVLKTNAA